MSINMKYRIVERTNVNGRIDFVIQQKRSFFGLKWVDACPVWCTNSFGTLGEAKVNLHYFNGATHTDRVVRGI